MDCDRPGLQTEIAPDCVAPDLTMRFWFSDLRLLPTFYNTCNRLCVKPVDMKTRTNKISGTYKTDLTVRRRVFAGLCQSVQLKILLPEEKKINFFTWRRCLPGLGVKGRNLQRIFVFHVVLQFFGVVERRICGASRSFSHSLRVRLKRQRSVRTQAGYRRLLLLVLIFISPVFYFNKINLVGISQIFKFCRRLYLEIFKFRLVIHCRRHARLHDYDTLSLTSIFIRPSTAPILFLSRIVASCWTRIIELKDPWIPHVFPIVVPSLHEKPRSESFGRRKTPSII